MKTAPPVPVTFEACLLAGGRSARMGTDKAALKLGGRTLLARIRSGARQSGYPVRVIRRDPRPRCGPLGGIYGALKSTRADAVIFLACDMPFVTAQLLERLRARFRPRRAGIFTVLNGRAGFPFILRRTVLPAVLEQIQTGQHSLQALASRLRAQTFRPSHALESQLANINTKADLAAARARWKYRSRRGAND